MSDSVSTHELDSPGEDLSTFFQPGIEPSDIQNIFRLSRAQSTLNAFSVLFSGSSNATMIRIMILQEIGRRTESPHLTPRELEKMFSYLDDTKRTSAINKLKASGLLNYIPEISSYEVSPLGRMAISAVSTLLSFGDDDGSEIGYLTSQIAASQALGDTNLDAMEHLLGRLAELDSEFDRALISGSEKRIKNSEARLASVWNWVAKGSEVIESISSNLDVDPSVHRLAQQIGRRQSKMLSMVSRFQAELNLIERNRVMIDRGVTTTDIAAWLDRQPKADLAAIGLESLTVGPSLDFLLSDILADTAEDVVLADQLEKELDVIPPPDPAEEQDDFAIEHISYEPLNQFHVHLSELGAPTGVENVVPDETFARSSYRLSLLSLVGRSGKVEESSPLKDFVKLPIDMNAEEGDPVKVDRCGVKEISPGMVTLTGGKND